MKWTTSGLRKNSSDDWHMIKDRNYTLSVKTVEFSGSVFYMENIANLKKIAHLFFHENKEWMLFCGD